MNFTNSPYEKMMKEIPRPGRGGADRCAGCRYLKECRISIRWPSMPIPSACTRRRLPGSNGTMKSSGGRCPMCSQNCLRW